MDNAEQGKLVHAKGLDKDAMMIVLSSSPSPLNHNREIPAPRRRLGWLSHAQ